jgi:glycosyltransferase involved in cell wall biosynthesis
MKSRLKKLLRNGLCKYYRLLDSAGINVSPEVSVNFVVEKADWAIRWVGLYICKNIELEHPGFSRITTKPAPIINRIIHFGSQYQWLLWQPHVASDNKIVVSFFHGKRSDGGSVNKHIDQFMNSVEHINYIVTGAELIRQRLISWGIESSKVIKIPIGCDTNYFIPPASEQRKKSRNEFGIRDNMLCIGSFQKDGVGWGNGMEPKLIKGPDVFVSAVKKLSREMPVFVLLTGPARGYVKQQLELNNIPYYHAYIEDYKNILKFYHALDLYLVTSREEGGPMALMESMATHVPVISTRVGQAEDLIEDRVNGGLVNVDDVDSICQRAVEFANTDINKKQKLLVSARQKVIDGFDWQYVAREHYSKVYLPLLKNDCIY